MLPNTIAHFVNHVIPSAHDYLAAERALSEAESGDDDNRKAQAAIVVKRRAAEAAIAIDALTDRAAGELGLTKTQIRAAIDPLCTYPTGAIRNGAHGRVRGVANAYKHSVLNDPTLPITSENDVLAVGLGWGLDAWGVGKMGGKEVIVQETGGDRYKFLGDIPAALRGWAAYVLSQGGTLPGGPVKFGSIEIYS